MPSLLNDLKILEFMDESTKKCLKALNDSLVNSEHSDKQIMKEGLSFND